MLKCVLCERRASVLYRPSQRSNSWISSQDLQLEPTQHDTAPGHRRQTVHENTCSQTIPLHLNSDGYHSLVPSYICVGHKRAPADTYDHKPRPQPVGRAKHRESLQLSVVTKEIKSLSLLIRDKKRLSWDSFTCARTRDLPAATLTSKFERLFLTACRETDSKISQKAGK